MAKAFACALTHIRHEQYFLEKWIAHYTPIVGGRENLHVVIDGDDWDPQVDLTGITTEIITDAPRRRIRNDQFMAKAMSGRANRLRKRYEYVIRGDVDEYVVVDPDAGLDWPQALRELDDHGYIFALGCDVVQSPAENAAVDRAAPILGQRRAGFIADRYTKPFVINRWANWAGGAHRLLNRQVRMSGHFVLFHLALADETLARDRMQARGGTGQHRSFVGHQTDRLNAISDAGLVAPMGWAEARAIAMAEFPVEPETGDPAPRPRPSRDPRNREQGLPVDIPARFHGML